MEGKTENKYEKSKVVDTSSRKIPREGEVIQLCTFNTRIMQLRGKNKEGKTNVLLTPQKLRS